MKLLFFFSLAQMLMVCIIPSRAMVPLKRSAELTRSKRQTSSACETDSACLPEGISSAPTNLVQCTEGQCVCNECFTFNSTANICSTCSSYPYDNESQECDSDKRRLSQRTAFLLSFFLSSTGAANFYIGRNDLAGGQLFLLILILVMSYCMCCFPCCSACCMAKEEMKGSIFFIVFMLLFALTLILTSLAVWAWWIADLVIFVTNQRLAGDGCGLNPNL